MNYFTVVQGEFSIILVFACLIGLLTVLADDVMWLFPDESNFCKRFVLFEWETLSALGVLDNVFSFFFNFYFKRETLAIFNGVFSCIFIIQHKLLTTFLLYVVLTVMSYECLMNQNSDNL